MEKTIAFCKAFLEDNGYQVVPPTVSLCRTCKYRIGERDYFHGSLRTCVSYGNLMIVTADGVRARCEELPASIRECPEYKSLWED